MCLGRATDLHMAQLMPLPLTVFCFSESRLILPFWYRLTRVVVAVKRVLFCSLGLWGRCLSGAPKRHLSMEFGVNICTFSLILTAIKRLVLAGKLKKMFTPKLQKFSSFKADIGLLIFVWIFRQNNNAVTYALIESQKKHKKTCEHVATLLSRTYFDDYCDVSILMIFGVLFHFNSGLSFQRRNRLWPCRWWIRVSCVSWRSWQFYSVNEECRTLKTSRYPLLVMLPSAAGSHGLRYTIHSLPLSDRSLRVMTALVLTASSNEWCVFSMMQREVGQKCTASG